MYPCQRMTPNELKNEILRAYILCQSLEPLAEKPGCTTRFTDSSPGTKLEYFILSAVNSAAPIGQLVDRIHDHGGQPDCVFDLAYAAQRRSPRNRHGGKVNYASIFMLLPIIIAQCLVSLSGGDPRDVDAILHEARLAMKRTTPRDVHFLQEFVNLSRALSERHHRRMGTTRKQIYPRFAGAFENVHDAMSEGDYSHMIMATEIRSGYRETKIAARLLRDCARDGLLRCSEAIYDSLLSRHRKPSVVADIIVVAFYLVFIENQSGVLLP